MLLSRWQAADLIDRDLAQIYEELSVTVATDDIKALVGQVREPYRALLRPIREAVRAQREQLGLHIRDAPSRDQVRLKPQTFKHHCCCAEHPSTRWAWPR